MFSETEKENRKRSQTESETMSDSPLKKVKSEEPTLRAIKTSSSAQLAIRIKSYLEENKKKQYIDIEEMAQYFYDTDPEYHRKKYKVFKGMVEKTFDGLKSELKQLSGSGKKAKKDNRLDSGTRFQDEQPVKKSVNKRMSDLYSKKSTPQSSLNTDDSNEIQIVPTNSQDPVEASTEEMETEKDASLETKITPVESVESATTSQSNITEENGHIEKDDTRPQTYDTNVPNGDHCPTESITTNGTHSDKQNKDSEVVEKRKSTENKDIIEPPPAATSDFERIKQSALKIRENIGTEKKTKSTRPSKSLSQYLSAKDREPYTNGDKVHSQQSSQHSSQSAAEDPQTKSENSEVVHMDTDDRVSTDVLQPRGRTTAAAQKNNTRGEASKSMEGSSSTLRKQTEGARKETTSTEDQEGISRSNQTKRPAGGAGSAAKKRKTKIEVSIQEPSTKFADFGGNDKLLCEICKLLSHLKHPEIYRDLGVSTPRGFLLHGPPGCGKTLLAHAIAGELELPFLKVSAPEIVSGVSGESESKIRDLFQQAEDCAPSVLFIDELDSIMPKRENAQREMERRIVAQMLTCLDELGKAENQVVVIGATNRPDSLDPALRRAGRFDREIALGIPDREARKKILDVLCKGLKVDENVSLAEIAMLTPGYVGADLSSLVRESAIAAANRMLASLQGEGEGQCELDRLLEWLRETSPLSKETLATLKIEDTDWKAALKVVQPSAKREGFATVPDVTWKDVGAMKAIRDELQLSILAPVRFQEEFEGLGLASSSGVLLAGPPGCGKTLVAKAIANEAGVNFISVKGPELLNMYVGESERAVRACFQRARNSAPCVIFFDEIDSLCPKRSGNSSDGGSSSRVVNQLLTEMDGVEIRNGVFLMAATNRPDIIDPAVLRPGRLDKILYVGFPSPDDRVDILKAITKNGTKPKLGVDVDLSQLGKDTRCNGYSGADVSALVREASMLALKDALHSGCRPPIIVSMGHFNRAFGSLRPSVAPKDRLKYDAMQKTYCRDNGSTDNIPSKTSSPSSLFSVPGNLNNGLDQTNAVEMASEEPVTEVQSLSEQSTALVEEPSFSGQSTVLVDNDEQITEMDIDETNQTEGDGTILREEREIAAEKAGCDEKTGNEVNSTEVADNVTQSSLVETATTTGQVEINPAGEPKIAAIEIVYRDANDQDESEIRNEDSNNDSSKPMPPLDSKTDAPTLSDLVNDSELILETDCTRERDELLFEKVEKSPSPEEPANVTDEPASPMSKQNESGESGRQTRKPSSEKLDSSGLRFLPEMLIRVADTSKVPSAAGKNGVVKKIRKNNKVTVSLEGAGLSQRIIDTTELEPFLPEEGDKVKILLAGESEETGRVVSMDGDICNVEMGSKTRKIEIENLCKISIEKEGQK